LNLKILNNKLNQLIQGVSYCKKVELVNDNLKDPRRPKLKKKKKSSKMHLKVIFYNMI